MNIYSKTSQFLANVAKLFKRDGDQFVSADETAKAKTIEAGYMRLMGQVDSCSHDAARNAVREPRTKYLKNPTDKNWESYTDAVQSRGEILRQFSAMRTTAKHALHEYHLRIVAPFCAPIVKRIADATGRKADELAAREKAEAEAIDVPYIESETLIALRTRERELRALAEVLYNGGGGPYAGVRGLIGAYVNLD